MMEEQLNCLDENIREAYQNVIKPQVTYVKKETLDRERTADKDPWFPSERTGRLIPNIHKLEVTLIEEGVDIVKVYEELVDSVNVGLALLGPEISRRQKPHLIVLSTTEKFYAIDPNDKKRGIPMMTKLLQDTDVTIWTTNGIYEADCLFHQYNIKLKGSRARCCTGLHVHLMRIMRPFPYHTEKVISMYPVEAMKASRARSYRLESYESLAFMWLDADPADLYCGPGQLMHLLTRPLNLTAMNLIKKRCCLITKLAQELTYYQNIEFEAMNRNILHCLTSVKHEELRKLMRKEIKACESKSIASVQYFAHLNGVFANPKPPSSTKKVPTQLNGINGARI